MTRTLLGRNLRDFRRLRQLTQRQLAGVSGIHLQTIKNIEKGEHSPNYDTLERLARGLEIPLSKLIEDPSTRSETTRFVLELRKFVSGLAPSVRRQIVSFLHSLREPADQVESTT